MSDAVAAIVAQLPNLSMEERAELATIFIRSLDPPNRVEDEEAFERELERRVASVRSGEAVIIPAEEVFAEWRNRRAKP